MSKGRRSPVIQLNARNTAAGPVANRTDIPAETVIARGEAVRFLPYGDLLH